MLWLCRHKPLRFLLRGMRTMSNLVWCADYIILYLSILLLYSRTLNDPFPFLPRFFCLPIYVEKMESWCVMNWPLLFWYHHQSHKLVDCLIMDEWPNSRRMAKTTCGSSWWTPQGLFILIGILICAQSRLVLFYILNL